MICPACGYKGVEEGDHRCGRCGRKLEPPVLAVPGSGAPYTATAAAPALAPEWKKEVAQKFEEFRNRRAQQGPFEEEPGEAVPPPDRSQKVLAFEDFAAGQIEPVVVEPEAPEPKPSAARHKPPRIPPLAPPHAPEAEPPAPELRPSEPPPVLRDVRCSEPVASIPMRAVAGVLDAAVLLVAAGLFTGVFQVLIGGLPLEPKVAAGLAGAVGVVAAFYLFLYVFYGAETPGMQWTGLRLLNYEGEPPRAGARLVRALGAILSAAALGLGYLWALIDEESLTWHDRMSQTFVTRDPGSRRHFVSR